MTVYDGAKSIVGGTWNPATPRPDIVNSPSYADAPAPEEGDSGDHLLNVKVHGPPDLFLVVASYKDYDDRHSLGFGYGEQHWDSEDEERCTFEEYTEAPYGEHDMVLTREGDCGFSC